jgi:hypothetical protein
MFGYYALLAAGSTHFWSGLDRESRYWEVFRQFAREMREMSEKPGAKEPLRF